MAHQLAIVMLPALIIAAGMLSALIISTPGGRLLHRGITFGRIADAAILTHCATAWLKLR